MRKVQRGANCIESSSILETFCRYGERLSSTGNYLTCIGEQLALEIYCGFLQ